MTFCYKKLFYQEAFIKIKVEAFKTIKLIIGGESLIMFVGQKINVLFTFIREVARSHPSSGRRRIGQSVSNTTTLNRLMLIYFSILGTSRKHLCASEQ